MGAYTLVATRRRRYICKPIESLAAEAFLPWAGRAVTLAPMCYYLSNICCFQPPWRRRTTMQLNIFSFPGADVLLFSLIYVIFSRFGANVLLLKADLKMADYGRGHVS